MPYNNISMEIVRTHIYERKSVKLLSEAELTSAEDEIVFFPEKWPIVSGTGGVRKARAARGTSGKSGGVRIIYYFWSNEEIVYMLDIYAKNEKENLTNADKKILKEIIKGLIN